MFKWFWTILVWGTPESCSPVIDVAKFNLGKVSPFAPGDFAEKHILKLVEWFSGHCRAIKS